MFCSVIIQSHPAAVPFFWLKIIGTIIGIMIPVVLYFINNFNKRMDNKVSTKEFEDYKELNEVKDSEMSDKITALTSNVDKYNEQVLKGIKELSIKVDDYQKFSIKLINDNRKEYDKKLADHRVETINLMGK